MSAFRDKIEGILRSYRCQYTNDGSNGAQLVDVFTPEGDTDISAGKDEVHLLADRLAAELAPPEEVVPEGCTPTDARVLREANAIFAQENHNLRRCLRFYANGDHYTGLKHWEGPSGDDNWLCPPSDDYMDGQYHREFIDALEQAMVEDGSVARATLISGKFEVESPEDEPKLIPGEPEWKIEQEAQALVSPQRGSDSA